jgi:hypothetical protein
MSMKNRPPEKTDRHLWGCESRDGCAKIFILMRNRFQALYQAILAQQQAIRQRYGDSNPFYWGAFVFMGEP